MSVKEDFLRKFQEAGGEVAPSLEKALLGFKDAIFCVDKRLKRRTKKFAIREVPPEEAEVSITRVDAAAAETGSLIFGFKEGEGHKLISLPKVHIAVLSTRRLYRSLDKALSKVDGDYISIVTGPSKTGDIELIHVAGVHGPERVILVLEGR